MKRLIGMILMIFLLCTTAGAHTQFRMDLIGTWYFNEAEYQGERLYARDLELDMTIVLNADGTMSMESMGQRVTGTWEISGSTLTLTGTVGAPAEAVYEDGRLVLVEDDVTMYLDPYEAGGAPVRKNVTEPDFYGVWIASYADMDQGCMELKGLNRSLHLTIQPGRATLSDGHAETENTMTTALQASALILTRARADSMTVHLRENGLLSMERADGVIYFEKTVDKAFRFLQAAGDDFAGRWNAVRIQDGTDFVSAASLNMTCRMQVEAENVLLTMAFSPEKTMQIQCTASLTEGILTADDGSGTTAQIWKNMDGTLSCQLDENVMIMVKEN